jgi:hypothetical protein
MPVYTLFGRSLSAPVDREGLGTLGPRLNYFNGLALKGRSSLRVNFGRPALLHGEILSERRAFQKGYGQSRRTLGTSAI